MQSKTLLNTLPNATRLSVLAWTVLAVCLFCSGCGSRGTQIPYTLILALIVVPAILMLWMTLGGPG